MTGARSNWSRDGYEHLTPNGAKNLLDCYQISQRPKSFIADPTHDDQMFGAAKRAEPFAVFDDALSQTLSDPGKFLEFSGGSGVDIDTWRVCLTSEGNGLRRIARLLIVRLWNNCL